MSKYLNVAIQDDTGKEIVNAVRALSGLEPLEINYKDVDRSFLDTPGKLLVEAIEAIGSSSPSGAIAELSERVAALETKMAIANVFRGSVETVDDLPDDANVGDVYDVRTRGINYMWTGEVWDAFSDDSDFISDDDIDALFPENGDG